MNVRDAAYSYLEHRGRSVREMRTHLSDKGFDGNDIEEVIKELKVSNYLNDVEYVIAYIDYGLRKKHGMMRIRRELSERGVSSDDIASGIDDYEEERGVDLAEEEAAAAMAEALRITADRPADVRLMGKVGRRLSTLGYGTDTVYHVIGVLMKGGGDE